MHGRVKVRTTEEQAEVKRKEQQEKLKKYLSATSKIFAKKENNVLDVEALEITRPILEHNADFYTLWNYRRDVLLSMKQNKNSEEMKNLISVELNLTQYCLQTNPKSYSAWHHRYWIMEFAEEADWKKELKLCNYFLSQDERNFHCWDYRRVVAKKCGVSAEEELKYTNELIESNFSNYSAWHYRSTLLPIVHPGATKGSITEDVLLKELELVQNAAFTDPDDQSVWFYHRWLLGRSKIPLQIFNISVIKSLRVIAVLLSESVKIDNQCVKSEVSGEDVNLTWRTVSPYLPVSSVWVADIPESIDLNSNWEMQLSLQKDGISSSLTYCNNSTNCMWSKTNRATIFRSELSAAKEEVLQNELESCQQLNELEPDSKWTLFTSILLMRALKKDDLKDEINEKIKHLQKVDNSRKKYYSDLESKFTIEDYIETLPVEADTVNLSNKNLSSLHHFDQFILIQTIDLSSNNLTSTFPLCYLLNVKKVILDDNKLSELESINLLQELKILSVKNNFISSRTSLESIKTCRNLEELFIEGNPITKDSTEEYKQLLEKLPTLKAIDGESL